MAEINTQYLERIISQLLTAADGGLKTGFSSADSIAPYVVAVIGLGAGLLPELGLPMFALCNLLGTVLFPTRSSIDDIWDSLRKRIEQLINEKIQEYHLRILRSEVEGFQSNMETYGRFFQDWKNADTPRQKDRAADTLKTMHTGFLSIVRNAIPEFQVDAYAVASLTLFSLAATIHLTLLADGIKHGREWGYSDGNIQVFQDEFKTRTGSGDYARGRDMTLPTSLLGEAISRAVDLGIPTEVLDTWKKAHASLSRPGRDSDNDGGGTDYVAYAKQTCIRGRSRVKTEGGSNYQGWLDARNYEAHGRYDTLMVLHVLNYAEIWPFMAGDEWTATAARNIDREIYYGPFSRWANNAPWSLSSPPPVTDRGSNITCILVRSRDDIDGIQIKHGATWDPFQGNSAGGEESRVELGPDDYISTVKVGTDFKFGQIWLESNDSGGWYVYGAGRHAGNKQATISPPGYELSNIIITGWTGDTPTGCEGVILGFRPLLTDAARN